MTVATSRFGFSFWRWLGRRLAWLVAALPALLLGPNVAAAEWVPAQTIPATWVAAPTWTYGWVEGHMTVGYWTPEYQDTVWVEGHWEEEGQWVPEETTQQWVEGYWHSVLVEGYWNNQWVDGYWDTQWTDGHWEETWTDGYYEDQWTDGYWDEEGNWNEGSWSTVWVDGYATSTWVEGFETSTWVEGYNDSTWVDESWEDQWVDGYYEDVTVPAHWESVWVDGEYVTVTTPPEWVAPYWLDGYFGWTFSEGYWTEPVTVPGHWVGPWVWTVVSDEPVGDWGGYSEWSPDSSTVVAPNPCAQQRTATRSRQIVESNEAGQTRSSTYTETGTFNQTVPGTGVAPGGGGGGGGTPPAVPAITSPAVVSGPFGTAFSYQIAASNTPTSYAATGLPSWLTLDSASGAVTGVPVVTGAFTVTLTATNALGTSAPLALMVTIDRAQPLAVFAGQIAENLPFFPVTADMLRGASSPSGLRLSRPANAPEHVPGPTNAGAATFSAVLPARNNQSYPSFPPTSHYGLIMHDGDLVVTGHYPGDPNYLAGSFTAIFANRDTLPPEFPPTGPALSRVLIDANKVGVRWEPATDVTAVVYDVSIDDGATVHASGITVNAKLIEGLVASTTYPIAVRARDPANGKVTAWSPPLSVTTLSGQPTAPTSAQRADVNGDGLPDEIIPNGSDTFSYFPLPEQPREFTYYDWQVDFIYFPGYIFDETSHLFYHPGESTAFSIPVPGGYVPVYSEQVVTIQLAQVTPVFQFSTNPDYDHVLARELTRADGSKIYRSIADAALLNLLGIAGSLQEWSPGGPWLESSYDTFPTVLSRLARPPAGVQINLPGIGDVALRAGTGGVTGTVVLPGNIQITAGNGSATIKAPGTGTVTIDSNGTVNGSATLPGGYVIGAASNGNVSISGPGGASISTGAGGTTLSIPGGTSVTVSSSGAIGLSVPGGTGALIDNAVDALGRLLGLDLGSDDIRGQVLPPGGQPTPGAWGDIRNILLGNRPPGVYDIATTSDTRGRPESPPNSNPAPANIVYIRLTVLPPLPTFVTPAGNPVSAAIEAGSDPANIPDGANEFTFSSGNPGILTIKLKALVPGAGAASAADKARYKFLVTAVGDSTPSWDAANPEGQPTFTGDILEAKITFTGLPTNNSAFGPKIARLLFAGLPVVDQPFEVFFPKFIGNHPGGQPNSPNWYHYWMQTPANRTNGYATVYNNGQRSFYNFLSDRKLYISNDAPSLGIPAWGSPVGIDTFAWATAHEAKHHTQLPAFWPGGVYDSNQDKDAPEGDHIRDSQEANYMPGRPYDPTKQHTYPDTIGYNGGGAGFLIRDAEDINMRTQTPPYGLDQLWVNGSANSSDWSNPGKNSKTEQ